MDSIAKFTKKHCHGLYQWISAVLLGAMAWLAMTGIGGVTGIALGAAAAVMAVLVIVHITGLPIGCTLLQIPLTLLSVCTFLAALTASVVGLMLVRFPEVEADVHAIAAQLHVSLDGISHPSGIPFALIALALYFLSTAAFAATSYLSTVKSCLKGQISRRSAKLFSAFAALLAVGAGVVSVWLGVTRRTLDAAVIECLLLTVLLAAAGLSANAFLRSTYAFKVFEEQVMKVETNADGTVYVPIQEDTDHADAPKPVPLPVAPKHEDKKSEKGGKKPFLAAYDALEVRTPSEAADGECDIL